MKNLLYNYTLDDHECLNKKLLDFFAASTNKLDTDQITSAVLPPEWQWVRPTDGWHPNDPWLVGNLNEDKIAWKILIDQHPNISYKQVFLDAAKDKLHEHARFHFQRDITGLYYKFDISHMWYNQTQEADCGSWKNRQSCQWSVLYFVEVSDDKYMTEFLDPESGEIIRPEAKAGDMLIFPSWLVHRSPMIQPNGRKTVISCDMDLCCEYDQDYIDKLFASSHSEQKAGRYK